MKKIFFLLIPSIIVFACNDMNHNHHADDQKNEKSDRGLIKETVTKFFIAVDELNWTEVKSLFTDSVSIDYTSMQGGEVELLPAHEIIDSWASYLPGFDYTHHQLGNFLVEIDNCESFLFCYVIAKHYLKNDSAKSVWSVVGSYDINLIKEEGTWRIKMLKFNLKYTSGNEDLPQMALENVK